jgi:hypothetical protein
MSYIVTHQRRDGSVERKRVRLEDPSMTPERAEAIIAAECRRKKKSLRDKRGWNRDRTAKLICSIPNAVVEEVFINDGPEASRDMNHLIKRSKELGFDVEMRR